MSVRTRLVLGTLCVFNAISLMALGFGSVFFVNGTAGPLVAGCLWFAAGALISTGRRLRKGTEWN